MRNKVHLPVFLKVANNLRISGSFPDCQFGFFLFRLKKFIYLGTQFVLHTQSVLYFDTESIPLLVVIRLQRVWVF